LDHACSHIDNAQLNWQTIDLKTLIFPAELKFGYFTKRVMARALSYVQIEEQ